MSKAGKIIRLERNIRKHERRLWSLRYKWASSKGWRQMKYLTHTVKKRNALEILKAARQIWAAFEK